MFTSLSCAPRQAKQTPGWSTPANQTRKTSVPCDPLLKPQSLNTLLFHTSLAFTALAADAQQHNGVAYIPNPQPTWHMVGGINVTVWKHLSGKQHAVAVAHTQTAPDTRVAVFTTTDVVADATAAAVAQVQAAAVAGPTTGVLAAHTEWWHAFYNTTGFVSFTGHPETEQFFWISTYKMASTTREGLGAGRRPGGGREAGMEVALLVNGGQVAAFAVRRATALTPPCASRPTRQCAL